MGLSSRSPSVISLAVGLLLTLAGTASTQLPKAETKAAPRIWDHQGSVLSIAFTPNGQLLVTGGAGQPEGAVIWEVATGKRLCGLPGTELVYSVALSPDGKKVATIGLTGIQKKTPRVQAAVWDVASGKELLALKTERIGARPCVAFSPDGKLLATGSSSGDGEAAVGAVQVWDATTGKALDLLIGPSETFSRLVFSPDGKTLAGASFGEDTFVVLWDVAQRKRLATLKSKTSWALIRSLAFSPDGKRLAWAAGNEVDGQAELVLWELRSAKRIAALRTEEMMAGVVFHPDGKSLIAVDFAGCFQVWDLATLKKTASFEVELAFPTMALAAALAPDGKTLVIGSGNSDVFAPPDARYGHLRLFDVATGKERLAPEKEAQRARDEAAQAARLAAEADAQARREAQERQELARLSPALRARLDRSLISARHLRYAQHLTQAQQAIERGHLAAARQLLQEYQPQPGQEDCRGFEWHYLWRQCQFQTTELEHSDAILAHCLSPDGKILAAATADHAVTLWELTTGKERARLQGASGPMVYLAFSPDGKYLATAGGKLPNVVLAIPAEQEKDDPATREAILWEVSSGKLLTRFKGHTKAIACVAFSANGKALAIGAQDGSASVWQVPSGKFTRALSLGIERAAVVTFAPDGKLLAVGGAQGAVSLWDLASGKRQTLSAGGDKKPIISLQFSPDGKALYSAEGDWVDNYLAKRWQRDGTRRWVVAREWKQVHRLALSPDGKRLALSGWHGAVLWDVAEDREVMRVVPRVLGDGFASRLTFAADSKTVLIHADGIRGQPELSLFDTISGERLGLADHLTGTRGTGAIHLAPGGKVTAVGIEGRRESDTAWVLQTTLGEKAEIRHYPDARGFFGVTSLAFHRDGQRLVVTDGQNVFVWGLRTGDHRKIFQSGITPIRKVQFAANGKTVLASYPPGVSLWDGKTGKQLAHVGDDYGEIAAEGKAILVPRNNGSITVFSANDGKTLGTLALKDAQWRPASADEPLYDAVRASPGGKWVVGFGSVLWDAAAQQEIKRWQNGPPPAQFGFTPDEKTLVTADRKGTVTVSELPSLKERHLLRKTWPPGGASAFSPDGRTAALEQADRTILLLDLLAGEKFARVVGLSTPVKILTFSPDGKSLVTGSADGTVCFWCPVTGAQRLNLRGHTRALASLAFSPDGTILATGSADQTVRLWFQHKRGEHP